MKAIFVSAVLALSVLAGIASVASAEEGKAGPVTTWHPADPSASQF